MKNFHPEQKEIGQRLRALRRKAGLTMSEVEKQSGISFSHISKLEVGSGKPGLGAITVLANFYGVSPEWILSGKEAGAWDQAQLSTNHVTHIKATNRSVVVNGHSAVQKCGEVIDATVKIAMDEQEIAKAKVIAQTLGCTVEKAMAILVRQKLET